MITILNMDAKLGGTQTQFFSFFMLNQDLNTLRTKAGIIIDFDDIRIDFLNFFQILFLVPSTPSKLLFRLIRALDSLFF